MNTRDKEKTKSQTVAAPKTLKLQNEFP